MELYVIWSVVAHDFKLAAEKNFDRLALVVNFKQLFKDQSLIKFILL